MIKVILEVDNHGIEFHGTLDGSIDQRVFDEMPELHRLQLQWFLGKILKGMHRADVRAEDAEIRLLANGNAL